MAQYRLTRPAHIRQSNGLTHLFQAGEVVTVADDLAPGITWQPLDQPAIDAFQARHGTTRLRPNGLQVYDAGTGKTKVPAASGGWRP